MRLHSLSDGKFQILLLPVSQDYFCRQETTPYALVYKKAFGKQQDKPYKFYRHQWQEPSMPVFDQHGNSFQVLLLLHIDNHEAHSFSMLEVRQMYPQSPVS